MAKTSPIIGANVGRVEGADKVSGQAIYGADVHFADALWGKILRSPYPHARIKNIDTSKAWKVEGVKAIVTGKDEPEHYQGKSIRDIPVMCWDKVRYVGDKVAAVAAESRDAAEEAVNLIDVEYEQLPAVFDVLEAMKPDAPILHDNAPGYDGAPADIMAPAGGNVLNKLTFGKGDIEKGFAEADLVLEHTFRMPIHHQGYLEPQSFLVKIDDDGKVNAWASTKGPFGTRGQFAKAAGIPASQIRLQAVHVGADFGGKSGAGELPICYFLAKQAKRPVKIVLTHTEELTAMNPDHYTVVRVKTGVKRDGRMTARYLQAIHGTGAYAGMKPGRASIGGAGSATPYKIDNSYMEALQVYTNTVPCGFWRAPGAIQAVFASESHMDLIAKELKMDPAKFRMMNLIGEGEVNALGKTWSGVKAKETLKAALDAAGWKSPKRPNVGRGVAMYERGTGAGKAWVNLTAEADGTLTVFTVAGDQGTGLQTVLCQTVAAEMQVPYENVRCHIGNTADVSYSVDVGFGGSRSTNINSAVAFQASAELRKKLNAQAAKLLDCGEDQIVYKNGKFSANGKKSRPLGLSDVVKASGAPVTVSVETEVPRKGSSTSFIAQVAEVEVDPETGRVKLNKFVSAHDVGTIINPLGHQGQIDGEAIMAIGSSLMEELIDDQGKITTTNLGEYKIPNILDIPKFKTVLVKGGKNGPGPYEAKGIGEHANVTPPAAIANAVHDACGVRLFDVPVTAEKVYRGLRENGR
ncbi:MAG: xanthine dehydrogenase family protein molybdopterin-binding subunit [Deltaproteobacteria bacterium]|jgi:CO/xanthine dehydrogenase Mo-binding subunit|nr:MAG: xanthine dehydrogenase family protein molybdopterin-binding subunit [Deltaproteobacteria bacterium]